MDTSTGLAAEPIVAPVIDDLTPPTFTVNLRKPIKDHTTGAEHHTIVIREPKVRDLLMVAAADEMPPALLTLLITEDGTRTLHALASKMPARDFRTCWPYVERCLAEVPMEGELPDTYSVTLREPIRTSTGEIGAIDLREPTASELIRIGRGKGVKGDVDAIAMISGVAAEDLGELPATAFMRAIGYIQAFFGDAPSAGAVS